MENFISDTEINIKHKITCRMCFCIALGWVVVLGWGLSVHIRFFGNGHLWLRSVGSPPSAIHAGPADGADQEYLSRQSVMNQKKAPPKRGSKGCSSHAFGRLSIT
jgi:hypothetical protein